MRLFQIHARRAAQRLTQPAPQILLGLTILLIALVSPGFPACTGMTLIAFGATATTVVRYHKSPARAPLLTAHLLIYISIYLLFVGASLDNAARHGVAISPLAAVDFVVSLLPMAAATLAVVAAICGPAGTKN